MAESRSPINHHRIRPKRCPICRILEVVRNAGEAGTDAGSTLLGEMIVPTGQLSSQSFSGVDRERYPSTRAILVIRASGRRCSGPGRRRAAAAFVPPWPLSGYVLGQCSRSSFSPRSARGESSGRYGDGRRAVHRPGHVGLVPRGLGRDDGRDIATTSTCFGRCFTGSRQHRSRRRRSVSDVDTGLEPLYAAVTEALHRHGAHPHDPHP
jgi:hypothetical protein